MESDLDATSESPQDEVAPAPIRPAPSSPAAALHHEGGREPVPEAPGSPWPLPSAAPSGTGPPAAAPPPKGLLELLVAPVTVAVVTALAGSFAVALNSTVQKAETERAFRASQIDAVVKVKPPATPDEVRLYAPRLAAYGEFAIPLLTAILEADPESDQGAAAERSLIQIALVSGKSAEVGRAMAIILQDKWQTFERPVHQSALRIISEICYSDARSILDSYAPKDVVKKWTQVLGVQEWVDEFTYVLAKARTIAASCAPKGQETRP
jgi:hypothetical protein